MSIIKFGLKLMGIHTILSFMEAFLMVSLMLIWDNKIYHWVIGIIYIIAFWVIIYSNASKHGLSDARNKSLHPIKGFVAGAVASLPGFSFMICSLLFQSTAPVFKWLLQVFWLSPYRIIFDHFEPFSLYPALILLIFFVVLSGLSYMDGLRKWKNLIKIMERKKITNKP